MFKPDKIPGQRRRSGQSIKILPLTRKLFATGMCCEREKTVLDNEVTLGLSAIPHIQEQLIGTKFHMAVVTQH